MEVSWEVSLRERLAYFFGSTEETYFEEVGSGFSHKYLTADFPACEPAMFSGHVRHVRRELFVYVSEPRIPEIRCFEGLSDFDRFRQI